MPYKQSMYNKESNRTPHLRWGGMYRCFLLDKSLFIYVLPPIGDSKTIYLTEIERKPFQFTLYWNLISLRSLLARTTFSLSDSLNSFMRFIKPSSPKASI